MKLRKVKCLLSVALVLSSMSVTAFADTGNNSETFSVQGNSIIIDKGDSSGDSTLLPDNVLDSLSKPNGTGLEESLSSPDTEVPIRKGSIKISLPDTSKKNYKGNVKFSLSKVADVVNGEYKLLDEYKSAGVSLNELKNSNDLDIAANMLKKVAKTDKTLVTDSNGVCSESNLDVGVYLLYASDIAKYENITPFLISIPVWDDTDKTMSFDVEVIPKHTPLPVKKPVITRAPSTGFSGGEIFGMLSGASLLVGTGMLALKKKKEE